MKYTKFIATISLLLASAYAFACGPFYYYPSEYYMFHHVGSPNSYEDGFNENSHENCLLWQQQSSSDIPLADIYQVVYKYDLELLTAIKSGTMPNEAKNNKMAQWLASQQGSEALDFLILAKNCEWLRRSTLSPWYYPSKQDPVKYSLNDVADVARHNVKGIYSDRYALQAVRAMTSLRQYNEIIIFWNKVEHQLPDGLMRRMSLSYVAGAYVHIDDIESAKQLYKQANDTYGLLLCDTRYHILMNPVEEMEILYDNYPDSPEFRNMLWNILGNIDADSHWQDERINGWTCKHIDYSKLPILCDRVINDNTNADKALWAYAASYIAHLKGNDKKADSYLKIAEKTVKDQPLADAIKVMRIYIDAQICTYDKAYEQKLFTQLTWLQGMIENNIDDNVINNTSYLYQLLISESYYYWNDALRCILLGTLCPKLVKQGNTTLALQLANMASYTLLNQVNRIDIHYWDDEDIKKYGECVSYDLTQYRLNCTFNDYDYSCNFAVMMDSLSANDLIAYTNIALNPKTEFQRFINSHSYIDSDYLNEKIGTHCLREMRYADAERYLSKVSSDYSKHTNVYKKGYLNHNPFSLGQTTWNHRDDAKLHFAKTMNRLEQNIASSTDPNQKANMMIEYSLGIRNSFGYCWALTQYRYGWLAEFQSVWQDDQLTKKAIKRSDNLFSQAFKTFTDNESAAKAQLLFCNYKTIIYSYPHTATADFVRGHCDIYLNYHAERKIYP